MHTATVYLIHLDSKIHNTAGHYLGYSALESVEDRLARHKRGNGARLLQVANEQGIDYHIVRTWKCTSIAQAKSLERKLKHRKDSPSLCPVCNPTARNCAKDSDCNMGLPSECNLNSLIPF